MSLIVSSHVQRLALELLAALDGVQCIALPIWVDAMAEPSPSWQVQPGDFVTTGTLTRAAHDTVVAAARALKPVH